MGCFQFGETLYKAAVNIHVQGFWMDIHFYFSWVNTWKWDGWVLWEFYVKLYKKQPNCFPERLYWLRAPPAKCESPRSSVPASGFAIVKLNFSHLRARLVI